MNYKHHYNQSHQLMNLRVNNFALLHLYKGYSIPSTLAITKKLTQQYVGPFQVLERIKRLAYRLNVLANWQIHNVFSIVQLEPASNLANDSFDWPRLDHSDSVFVEGNTDDYKLFEIERFLNKHITR